MKWNLRLQSLTHTSWSDYLFAITGIGLPFMWLYKSMDTKDDVHGYLMAISSEKYLEFSMTEEDHHLDPDSMITENSKKLLSSSSKSQSKRALKKWRYGKKVQFFCGGCTVTWIFNPLFSWRLGWTGMYDSFEVKSTPYSPASFPLMPDPTKVKLKDRYLGRQVMSYDTMQEMLRRERERIIATRGVEKMTKPRDIVLSGLQEFIMGSVTNLEIEECMT